MNKRLKPFFSYDVEKTEEWLSEQASIGNNVTGLHPIRRQFTFENRQPGKVQYQILYSKKGETLPIAVKNDGWDIVGGKGKWSIAANAKALEDIQAYPTREGILKRNRVHLYVFTGIAMLLAYMVLMNIILFSTFHSIAQSIQGKNPIWEVSPFILVGIIVFAVVVIISLRKLRAFERKYRGESVSLKNVKEDTFVRYKFGWIYSPDKIEKWLEKMALEGNHLVKMGRINSNFYFKKGEPKLTSYIADYQVKTEPDYFSFHREAGWELKFTTFSSFTKWSIWAKDYEMGEEKPQLYYDPEHVLSHSRKVFLGHGGIITPIVIMYLFLFPNLVSHGSMSGLEWFSIICFGLATISFLCMVIQSGRYYFRVRKIVKR